MHIRKWHKFRASKYQFPTTVIEGSRASKRKGSLILGRIDAKAHLERVLGRSLDGAVLDGTRSEWIFKFLVGAVPPRMRPVI